VCVCVCVLSSADVRAAGEQQQQRSCRRVGTAARAAASARRWRRESSSPAVRAAGEGGGIRGTGQRQDSGHLSLILLLLSFIPSSSLAPCPWSLRPRFLLLLVLLLLLLLLVLLLLLRLSSSSFSSFASPLPSPPTDQLTIPWAPLLWLTPLTPLADRWLISPFGWLR